MLFTAPPPLSKVLFRYRPSIKKYDFNTSIWTGGLTGTKKEPSLRAKILKEAKVVLPSGYVFRGNECSLIKTFKVSICGHCFHHARLLSAALIITLKSDML